ncbi:MAG TPA: hypothetical protein VJA26_12780 [Gammaproteobacteria bacterium]|nr:hypothetical protein [Gammaproteobacteria bacterium]
MFLGDLQNLLTDVYALDMAYDIRDFLITDASLAHALDGSGRRVDEKLLIAEDSGEAQVGLYLEERLVDRLNQNNPATRLDSANLEDFWTAFEGISHFTYYAWNATLEKSVTLLEMELQAEVDKFIATSLLLQQQGEAPPRGLHHWLFELPKLDCRLNDVELERYRRANRYAGRYCRRIGPALARGLDGDELKRELRRFYRLSQPAKIEHIEAR